MAEKLREFRGIAVAGLTAAAAVVAPPDPFSLVVWGGLGVVLYEAGMLAVAWIE